MWHGAGTPTRFVERSLLRRTLFDFDLSLTSGSHDIEVIKQMAAENRAHLETAAVGMPYLDQLATAQRSRKEYLTSLGLNPARRTILFAPHWGPGAARQVMSAQCFDECVTILRNLEYNIIFKPHAWTSSGAASAGSTWD